MVIWKNVNFINAFRLYLTFRIFFLPKLEMQNELTCSLWHSFYSLKNQFLSGLMKPQSCGKHFMVLLTIMDDSQLIKEIASRRWHFMLQTLKTLVCTEVLWVVFIHVIFENTKLFVVSCVSDSLLGNWTVVASISNVRHYPSRNHWNFTSVLTIPH